MRKSHSSLLIFTLNCLIIFSVSEIVSFAQIYSSAIKEKFNFQEEYILSEKIYLHSDRTVYVIGENIFFKAYYFLNGTFKKDSISSIAYVDLVDENGQSQATGKYPIENSMTDGNLLIPQGLASGYYTIYAYTRWMMNFDKDCFFTKKIYIINPESQLKILKKNQSDNENILLNFYAEGGNLKINTHNPISVIATNKFGEILEKRVNIIDQDNNPIAEVQTPGYFDFKPEQDKEYKALIVNNDGSQNVFSLPKAVDFGIKSMLNRSINGNLWIEIELTDINNPDNKDLKILLENNGLIYKQIDVEFFNNKYQVDIQKKELMQGFNLLYIKNKKNQIIYKNDFINRLNDKFQIETLLNKEIYHAREKVNVKIKTVSADKNLKNTNLSVSIAKSDLLNIDTNNISDYLDYSCKINRCNDKYPLDGKSKILTGHNSDTIQHSSEVIYLPETSGFIISGTIQSAETNKPIPDVNIYLSTLSNHIDVQNAISKKDGKFYFLMNEKVKNTDFVIQPADQSLKDYKVIIDEEFVTKYPSDEINILRENKFNKTFFEELVINNQIEEQYYPNPQSDSSIQKNTTVFYGKADTSYSFRKFIDLPTFEEYFVEIFSQTKIIKGENGKQILLSYLGNRIELNQFPLLLVDGIPIFDVDKFLSISPSKIDKVDIINDDYVLGGIKYGGIIHVYTKKKNFASLIDTKNLSLYKFRGFTEKNKFREINYTDEIALESRKADFRNTLYWNPEIITDENSEANFSFYTSDEKGKFLITIEGAGENGETGSKQMVLEVE
jgi:hypothetical protein